MWKQGQVSGEGKDEAGVDGQTSSWGHGGEGTSMTGINVGLQGAHGMTAEDVEGLSG